jgi:hypothetical protein
MAMHYDTVNHNSYPDGCTLTSCTFVHVGEGTTGTISDTHYAEIGEDNSITISGVNYLTIGENNTNVTVSNSDFIIIGDDNANITIGSHSTGSGLTGTGGNSINITREVRKVEITGIGSKIHKTRYTDIDGYFNKVDFSKNVYLKNANSNRLNHSTVINMEETNNNDVQSAYMELKKKQPFYEYNLIENAITVESMAPPVVRQSDNTGIILDNTLNKLINKTDSKGEIKKYTKINGQWAEIQ